MQDPQEFTVDKRWLPPRWQNLRWFEVIDTSAIETGDVIFNPASHAHYAGSIDIVPMSDAQHPVWRVTWYKSIDNVFPEYLNREQIERMYYADPIMQDAGKCACGSNSCRGTCSED